MAYASSIAGPALLAACCLFLFPPGACAAAGQEQVKEAELRVVSALPGAGQGGAAPEKDPAPFQEGDLWGYRNAAGETVISPVFDSAEDFREGLAPVLLNGKWGFIDWAGRMRLEPQYEGWNHFSGGRALVKLGGEWVVIDAGGAVAGRPSERDRSDFIEGLAFFRSGGKYGYMNPAGDTEIPPEFEEARQFSEGLAAVKKGKWGFIDKGGDFSIRPGFEAVGQFHEGLVPFLKNGAWGFLNRKGRAEIAANFDDAQPFYEGLAAVRLSAKWGYIDKTGRIALRPQYLEAGNFSGGQAVVTVPAPAAAYSAGPRATARRWIDRQGNTLFQSVGAEYEGMQAVATPEGLYGYMVRSKTAVPPGLEDAKTCLDKLCLVKKSGRYVFIDYSGAVKLETGYDGASEASCGFYRVRSGGKYGFIDAAGAAAAQPVYDVLEPDACAREIKAVLDGRPGVVRPSENWRFFEAAAPKDARAPGGAEGPAPALPGGAMAQPPVPGTAAAPEIAPDDGFIRENRAGHLVAFELDARPQLLPVRTPLTVNVLLKRRFNGKLRLYSTDMNRLVLLDVKKGEYLKSMLVEVNGVPGKVFTVDIGLLPAGEFPGLLLGAEVAETASMKDTRYHALKVGEETVSAPPGGDWFPEEAVENLLLVPQNRFGAARGRKLLASDKARADKALPQLVRWFTLDGAKRSAAEEGLKTIVRAYGGAEAVAQVNALLRDDDRRNRVKWLQALRLCGPDAKAAAVEIKVFFDDDDKETRDSAFALYRELGLEIPAEYAAAAGLPAPGGAEAPAQAAESAAPASGYAAALSTADAQIMVAAEKALESGPPAEESARLYLLLGRLKKSVEGDTAYAGQRPGEYTYDEAADRYLYNGKHFMHLLMKFPEGEAADEAAYELTKLSSGSECAAGLADCRIERQFGRVARFLKDRAGSRFAEEAVARANEAFATALKDTGDYNLPRGQYNPERVKDLLREYDDLAALFPRNIRVKAYLTIAGLWGGFRNYERAKRIYKAVLADSPDEAAARAAKEGLAALPAPEFILSPVKTGGSSPELEWSGPALEEITEYVVYRSSVAADYAGVPADFARLARVQGTQFSDLRAQPGAAYWYYVEAVTPKGNLTSNRIYCRFPAAAAP